MIDYNKLRSYVRLILNIRLLKNNESKYIMSDFRMCTRQDFIDNGYSENLNFDPRKFLCPDTDHIKQFYRLKNEYGNRKE